MINKRNLIAVFFTVFLLLLVNSVFSYTSSNVQLSQYGIQAPTEFDASVCSETNDLLLQIAPFGCSPAVVRTDLLEENNVPVFCQISATKINPLIDIQSVDSISFTGNYPNSVAGIAYYPAKAALKTKTELNSPVLNNIGYVIINLKRQSNASAMPDFVEGTLTANVKYDVDNAFGIGSGTFYLPELNEDEWQTEKNRYGFWNGKGYIRADTIDSDNAIISIYSGDTKISSVNVQKGQTSNNIYLPGFTCQAGLKVKLLGLENPGTRAKLRVNAEVIEVGIGEKFLENKCTVRDIKNYGVVQKVSIRCSEDDKVNTFDLIINPKVILDIGGQQKEAKVGDYLYDYTDGGKTQYIYLGYIGTNRNSNSESDLYVYLFSSSEKKTQLDDSQISSINLLVAEFIKAGQGQIPSGLISDANVMIKQIVGASYRISRFLASSEKLFGIDFAQKDTTAFGKKISIVKFSEPRDAELTADVTVGAVRLSSLAIEHYDNAKKDYETLRQQYASDTYTSKTTYGEEALYNLINLSYNFNQKRTAKDLCEEFKSLYPNSAKKTDKTFAEICDNLLKLSSDTIPETYVLVNGQVKQIFFDGTDEPNYDEYWAKVSMRYPDGHSENYQLVKDKAFSLDTTTTNYLELSSADDSSARVKINLNVANVMQEIIKQFGSNTIRLDLNTPVQLAEGYTLTLTDVHVEKFAKVSIIPNIQNTGTTANFSFKIGIEKRAFSLPPEKAKEKINDLDGQIKQWTDISNNLGGIVKGLQTSCIVTTATLVAGNFLSNAGGKGIARQNVMNGANGWKERCANLVASKQYSSTDACYNDKADEIDKQVEEMSKIIEQQNKDIKELEKTATVQNSLLGETVINNDKFVIGTLTGNTDGYLGQVRRCVEGLPQNNFNDPRKTGTSISKEELLTILTDDGWKRGLYNIEDLRNIELFCESSKSSILSEGNFASTNLYSNLFDVKTNAKNYADRVVLSQQAGISTDDMVFIELGENVRKYSYEGLTNSRLGNKAIPGFSGTTPVSLAPTNHGTYIFVLNDSLQTSQIPTSNVNGVLQIYDYNTLQPVGSNNAYYTELANIYFIRYDSSSYVNEYKNPQLKYYETEPYKGMPALVPFDRKNGWYASVKQTLAVGNNIQSYDASGRLSSLYVCNVGKNGLEENRGGDDDCRLVNLGTGEPYNAFGYLSPSDAKRIIDNAINAVEQASNIAEGQRKGTVRILNQNIPVGPPAADIPEFECQNFMSPKDCLLIFNLCDPVICPSSRCDLGGAYPVRDVVQSGIIGSIALCLPNAKEGIIMPVCLTGIKAGIDGWVSVKQAYKDCLQESIDTGELVGICDEMYSVYMCDFFWKQTLPFADIIIPKVFEFVLGQNVRGGGEYLGVSNAWQNAQNSVNYFTNYYGANAKNAFLARSTEVLQDEVCKSFVSGVIPNPGDLLDSLSEPASPNQFYGRFDENILTTATVPPTSHYKVFYHIFAGKDAGAYYSVYLKGDPTSSYYRDTASSLSIASGYIAVGNYATDSKDITATAGYTQLCISVNGQEECGFKQVTTNFAVDYIKDSYLSEQATKEGITRESDCVSGTASIYSLLNPNLQSAAEEIIDPELYARGITRICATTNPGAGTDRYVNTGITGAAIAPDEIATEKPSQPEPICGNWVIEEDETCDDGNQNNGDGCSSTCRKETIPPSSTTPSTLGTGTAPGANSRWKDVGYCDDPKIRCWLDRESVENAIDIGTIRNKTLYDVTQDYLKVLRNEEGYLNEKEFASAVEQIQSETDNARKITLINNLFDKAFWSGDKALLILLRGNAYSGLLTKVLQSLPKIEALQPTEEIADLGSSAILSQAEILKLTDTGQRMVETARTLNGTIVLGSASKWGFKYNENCWTSMISAYDFAGLAIYGRSGTCGYADIDGKSYTFRNEHTGGKDVTVVIGETRRGTTIVADGVISGICNLDSQATMASNKLDGIQPGYLLSVLWNGEWAHNVIFIRWIDKEKRIAQLFDWNARPVLSIGGRDKNGKECTSADLIASDTKYCKIYRIYKADLNDNINPVFAYWAPYIPTASVPALTPKAPSQTFVPPVVSEAATQNTETISAQEFFAWDRETGSSSEITPSASTSVPSITTMSGKIYSAAESIAGSPSTDAAARFVSQALKNAGVTGIEISGLGTVSTVIPSTVESLISIIEKKSEFSEVNVNDLKIGDIVVMGKECTKNYSIGIVAAPKDSKNKIQIYTNLGNRVKLENMDFVVSIENSEYFYKAYRYTADTGERVSARIKWTLDSALSRFSTSPPTGKYTDNKQFVDELFFDGILNFDDCKWVRPGTVWFATLGKGQSMTELQKRLLAKKAISGGAH